MEEKQSKVSKLKAINFPKIMKAIKESIPGWIFILPMFLGICVFVLYPIIESIIYSLYEYNIVSVADFIGFANYARVFSDPEIKKAIVNTVLFGVINIPMVTILTYALALLLNMNIPGVKFFRILYYLPCTIPAIAGGILWTSLLQYGGDGGVPGVFNAIRLMFGLQESKYFFSTTFESIRSILVMNLWGIGGGVITWLAAFKNIPEQLYEAADIDGANRFVKLFKITIPLSGPLFLYNMITLVISTVQFNGTIAFAPDVGAGYNNSTLMLGVKVYIEAFARTNIGYAAALSWILMLITTVITLIIFRVDKWVNDGNN